MRLHNFIVGIAVLLISTSLYAANLDTTTSLSMLSYFGIGILLAFTPCVLPMIPILSGILIGQNEISTSRSFKLSLAFVLGMAITYALAGVAAGYLGSTLQTSLQIPWVIILFSSLIGLMGIAMFDGVQLKMPGRITNAVLKVNNKLSGGTLLGVAGMGMLSTLIASPCVTAPMVAILTYISQSGDPITGGLMLFALALGMGAPLVLFGIGQGTILPKTGPWMITLKKIFGFAMFGLSIWMLSRIIPGNITLLLTAALLIISAIFLGALQFNAPTLLSAFSFFALVYGTLLLVGALQGNEDLILPLKSQQQVTQAGESGNFPIPVPRLFNTINSAAALQQALAKAKIEHKPVLVEFYASWCPDCRALDKAVFAHPKIQYLMQSFAAIRVDISRDNAELKQLRAKYHVYGVPSLIFYDKNGDEVVTDRDKELTRDFVETKLLQYS